MNFFNPSTGPLGMDLQVQRAGRVRVRVYNVAGERVCVLMDAVLSAGSHRVAWPGTNSNGQRVGNGVYFLVFETPSGRSTRKVVVLK
jgi:flagellar hook assembly protein FlgD